MSYFDRFTADHFKDLPDGRSIFYPRGPDGPAYLVPDRPTRTSLERSYKIVGLIATAASVVLAHVVGRRGASWYWLFSLLLLPVLHWLVGVRAVERLTEVYEPHTPIELRDGRLEGAGVVTLWLLICGAAAASVAAFAVAIQHPLQGVRLLALAVGILLTFTIPVSLQELGRRRIEKRQHESLQPWRPLRIR